MILEDFRSRFKSIIYIKGEITSAANHIKKLSRWDKNGSHANAIKAVQEEKSVLTNRFREKLGDLTYEEWLEISRKLSALNSKKRQLVSKANEYETKINVLLDSVEEKSLIPSP